MPGSRHTVEDINQLVAFAQTFQEISAQRPQHKIPPRPSRSEKIQDALASILDNGTHGELYAVGTHVDYSRPSGAVTIVVASNHEIPASAENYLKDIWSRLRRMEKTYKGSSLIGSSREYRKFVRKIYSRCFERFKKRVVKGYDSIMRLADSKEFCRFLKHDMTQAERQMVYYLLDVIEEIGLKLVKCTKAEFLDDSGLLMERMWVFHQVIQKQKQVLARLDRACIKLKLPPIVEYINKVASLHASIKVFERHMRSPMMRRILKRRLVVKRLSPEFVAVQPPSSKAYRSLFRKVFKMEKYHKRDTRREAVKYMVRTAEKLHGTDTKIHSVHPECKVLEYFSTRPFSTLSPPLGYIGASKTPCVASRSLFRAWNTISPYRTYTCRGSQGRLYRWAFPRGLRAPRRDVSRRLIDAIYRHLVGQISIHLTATGCPVCAIREAAKS